MDIKYIRPADIERRSMEIIASEMKREHPADRLPVIRRVIHTTADFDYEDNLRFSDGAVRAGIRALRQGCTIVSDTNMTRSGINSQALQRCGARAVCFMADSDVAGEAAKRGVTRAVVSMEKASEIRGPVIFAIGNAPTALIRLRELIDSGKTEPALVIAVPVGFVNVTESKELIMESGVPYIAAAGRKGGSTVAAAICNALLYMLDQEEGRSRG